MFDELKISVPSIGANCFYNVWCPYDNDSPKGKLTLTDKVTELGANAFAENELAELQFESNAVTGAYNFVTGVFYESDIYKLSIGENVTMIQPYLFSNSELIGDGVLIGFEDFTNMNYYLKKTCGFVYGTFCYIDKGNSV